jgi:2-polyprenyl-3-methyl-5-hydroxy-6-metoxy-1,4-benzoquinol methylase
MYINKDWTAAEKIIFRFFGTYLGRSYSSQYSYWKEENAICSLFDRELLRFATNSKIKVLDLGCGIGSLIFELARRHKKSHQLEFTGIDISPDFIDIARKIQGGLGLTCNFLVIDAEKGIGGIQNDTFDIIICNAVLEHLVDFKKAVEEMQRIVKPDGLVIIGVPNYSPLQYKLIKFIDKALLKGRLRQTFFRGLYHEEIDIGEKFDYGYGHIAERHYFAWMRLFKEAGLEIECVKNQSVFSGSMFFDRHPIIFSCGLIFDSLLNFIPWGSLISCSNVFGLRKGNRR